VGPRLAASACYSFSPHMVGAHVPAAWAVASPPQILAARERAVDRTYRALLGDLIDSPGLAEAADLAREAALAADTAGRPLAAANADLPWPGEPHLVLWHAINVLREEISGDGWWHVAAFTALRLTPEAIHGSKCQMMQLAVATGIRYHGWQVSLNGGELAQLASRWPDLAGAVSDELPPDDTLAAVEIPDLADLIWLFEDEPTVEYPDLAWPVGLHSFRLRRGDREVLFSVDPASGEAQISLYVAGQEMACLGRLRWIETFTIVKKDGYEGLVLHFAGGQHEPLTLQTRPEIRLTWDVVPVWLPESASGESPAESHWVTYL
jgi:hypothetical protein